MSIQHKSSRLVLWWSKHQKRLECILLKFLDQGKPLIFEIIEARKDVRYTFFHKKKVYKKMRLKWSKSYENHEAQFPKFSVFIGQKSMFPHLCIENAIDGIQLQVCNISNEIVSIFGQFILVKVEKNLRKSQALFREKLRKLRLRQNYDFLIKKTCILIKSVFRWGSIFNFLLCLPWNYSYILGQQKVNWPKKLWNMFKSLLHLLAQL